MRPWAATLSALALGILLFLNMVCCQHAESPAGSIYLTDRYAVVPNVTYLTVNGWDGKLDLYLPRGLARPHPTLIYIHGGGWMGGSKEDSVLHLIPYIEMGWAVVNVEYRLGHSALAPAAVEDCHCALRWVIRHAKQYNLDPSKLVISGYSAGGHLALIAGMLPASAGFDGQCPGTEDLKVAAIINWSGITDVGDLLDGPNRQDYAVAWLGNQGNGDEIAKRISPLHYVRHGLPPILTIHGSADPIVPYDHAVKLHAALDQVDVPHRLVTIPGGKHWNFGRMQTTKVYSTIRAFLSEHRLMSRSSSATCIGSEFLACACGYVTGGFTEVVGLIGHSRFAW